ncbi:MAG TPA: MBL fold metallo-hydrolase [Steroidobacteraceae bacterium]|nr:MBL fold metallo-hydrolase [Steroidobacteraceae bacterium]
MLPTVESFYDIPTSTFTHVVYDRAGGRAAIVDPVLDFDPSTARTTTVGADSVLRFLRDRRLTVDWILETHAHADHLTAAHYLKAITGAQVAIGRGISLVQQRFSALFGLEPEFPTNGSQFDRLLADDDTFPIGELSAHALATPGHTDDSLTYLIGDAAFVGDTLFAADTGTARADFPGGDAHKLYRSIQKLFALPDETRIFLCHDYPPAQREARAQSSVAEQKARNVHVGGAVSEESFVRMRAERDAKLPAPRLILPSLQVNIRAGALPPPDRNGISYLRLPINQLGATR